MVLRAGPGRDRLRRPRLAALRLEGDRDSPGRLPPEQERAHGPGRHSNRGLDLRSRRERRRLPATSGRAQFDHRRVRNDLGPSRIAASRAASSSGETSRSTRGATSSRPAATTTRARVEAIGFFTGGQSVEIHNEFGQLYYVHTFNAVSLDGSDAGGARTSAMRRSGTSAPTCRTPGGPRPASRSTPACGGTGSARGRTPAKPCSASRRGSLGSA